MSHKVSEIINPDEIETYVDVTDALKKKEITAFDDYMTTKLET